MHRLQLELATLMTLLSTATVAAEEAPLAQPAAARFFIGTYTGEKSKGIYTATLDPATGALEGPTLAAEVKHPSFLAIHPNGKFLYAVSEVADADGKPSGAVVAYEIKGGSGVLARLNHQSSEGAGPCHLVVDATGKALLVANYGGGSVAALPIGNDGRLGKATSAVQHAGSSINKQRQEGPHAHSVNISPDNRFAFVADLGLDQVLIYRLDPARSLLEKHNPPHASVTPGAGPRHFAFRPDGKFAYVINELANTVTAFAWNAPKGELTTIQEIGTLPADFKQTSYTAEVVVHPTGKYLYGSNRGHDSIAMFSIDGPTGRLTSLGQQSTLGKTPRNFVIDPTGTYLLAENQLSDSIVAFRIDGKTGKLAETGNSLQVPSPVCVRFLK